MIIDLTRPFPMDKERFSIKTREVYLPSEWCNYTGVCHTLTSDGMTSTYIDFPGHIKECANGETADTYPLEKLLRQEATVIHLDKVSGDGAVSADELTAAAGGIPKTPCLVLNALRSGVQVTDIDPQTVWLDRSAVDWIISTGCHLFVSDIYERRKILGVFKILFDAGISTVCVPHDLFKLPNHALISAICVPWPGVVQLPCRLFAEI